MPHLKIYATIYDTVLSNARIYEPSERLSGGSIPLACLRVKHRICVDSAQVRCFSFDTVFNNKVGQIIPHGLPQESAPWKAETSDRNSGLSQSSAAAPSNSTLFQPRTAHPAAAANKSMYKTPAIPQPICPDAHIEALRRRQPSPDHPPVPVRAAPVCRPYISGHTGRTSRSGSLHISYNPPCQLYDTICDDFYQANACASAAERTGVTVFMQEKLQDNQYSVRPDRYPRSDESCSYPHSVSARA